MPAVGAHALWGGEAQPRKEVHRHRQLKEQTTGDHYAAHRGQVGRHFKKVLDLTAHGVGG